jgi:Cof subfamily protein (haloacid dehalogenase superfamily)
MAIKLIALDIDGTLTNQQNIVTLRVKAAVKKAVEAGIIITIATGRGGIATRPIWRELGLHGASIQYGGAVILDIDTEQVISLHELPADLIHIALDISNEMNVTAQIYQDDVVIVESMNLFTKGYLERHNLPCIVDPDIRKKTYMRVPKILAFADEGREETLYAAYRERLAGIAQVSRSNACFIEINCLGITKASALEELSQMLGIPRTDVAAVGDNYLDREMIEWAGLGVCMADGAEEVKQVADLIIPPCSEDGVAVFIEEYVLR